MFSCQFTIFFGNDYPTPYEDSKRTITVSNFSELRQAVEVTYKNGDITVLCNDGVYQVPAGEYFSVSGDHTTIKSKSGNRDKVVIKGLGMNGSGNSVIHISADYVAIKDLTISDTKNHGIQIHGEKPYNADYAYISNVVFKDINEQMIKGSGNDENSHANNGIIENCLFYYSKGVANQDYCGGIDIHRGTNWVIHKNEFRNIKSPNSTGQTQRPKKGVKSTRSQNCSPETIFAN